MASKGRFPATVKKQMKALGTYRPEFDAIINDYCELTRQQAILTERFQEGGYQHAEGTTTGGSKKDPLLAALETYRKDILTYAMQLGLTPYGLKRINNATGEESGDPLDALMSEIRSSKKDGD